jgi:hypothetical protein
MDKADSFIPRLKLATEIYDALPRYKDTQQHDSPKNQFISRCLDLLSKMTLPTAEQQQFIHNYCAKLIDRALTTNFLGLGRDDQLLIRILTSLTRTQAIGVDLCYRTINTQNQSLPMKLESFGGSYGQFLSALTQSTESFHGDIHSPPNFSHFP